MAKNKLLIILLVGFLLLILYLSSIKPEFISINDTVKTALVIIDDESYSSCQGEFNTDNTFYHICEYAFDENENTYAIQKLGQGAKHIIITEETTLPGNITSIEWNVKMKFHPFGGGPSFYYYNYKSKDWSPLPNTIRGDGDIIFNLTIPKDGFLYSPLKIKWDYTGDGSSGVNGYYEGKAIINYSL